MNIIIILANKHSTKDHFVCHNFICHNFTFIQTFSIKYVLGFALDHPKGCKRLGKYCGKLKLTITMGKKHIHWVYIYETVPTYNIHKNIHTDKLRWNYLLQDDRKKLIEKKKFVFCFYAKTQFITSLLILNLVFKDVTKFHTLLNTKYIQKLFKT